MDEYAGRAGLECRIKKIKKGTEDEIMMKRFIVKKPDSNYERDNFAAKCFICQESLKNKRELGAHIRSEQHKAEFRKYSLNFAKYDEEVPRKIPAKKVFIARLTKYSYKDSLSAPVIDICNGNQIEGPDSPMAIIDGHHESLGAEQDIEELSLPSLTEFDLEPDNKQLRAKICLRTNNLWTSELETRWLEMQRRETRIIEQYNRIRETYINDPGSHPLQKQEWTKFWDRRSMEVEAAGKNPNDYNYTEEWLAFWLKRVQEIMKVEAEKQMFTMKQSLGLDADTLVSRWRQHNSLADSPQVRYTTMPNHWLPNNSQIDTTQPPPSHFQNKCPPLLSSIHGQAHMTQSPPTVTNQWHVSGGFNSRPVNTQDNFLGIRRTQQTNRKFVHPANHTTTVLTVQPSHDKPRFTNSRKSRKDLRSVRNRPNDRRNYRRSPPGRCNRKDDYRNDRNKRDYRRSPKYSERRPSHEEKHARGASTKKVTNPDSDWESEPQNKVGKWRSTIHPTPLESMTPTGNCKTIPDDLNKLRVPLTYNNEAVKCEVSHKKPANLITALAELQDAIKLADLVVVSGSHLKQDSPDTVYSDKNNEITCSSIHSSVMPVPHELVGTEDELPTQGISKRHKLAYGHPNPSPEDDSGISSIGIDKNHGSLGKLIRSTLSDAAGIDKKLLGYQLLTNRHYSKEKSHSAKLSGYENRSKDVLDRRAYTQDHKSRSDYRRVTNRGASGSVTERRNSKNDFQSTRSVPRSSKVNWDKPTKHSAYKRTAPLLNRATNNIISGNDNNLDPSNSSCQNLSGPSYPNSLISANLQTYQVPHSSHGSYQRRPSQNYNQRNNRGSNK